MSALPGAAPDKRAAQIAQCIEADIIRRGWPVGESLGTEHDLQQRYRASRSVLREAVRLVEHHRVARMRRGPNGGLLVSAPDAAPATRAVVIYLEHRGTTVDDLLNARGVLEPLAAACAAAEIDEAAINRLRDIRPGQHHDMPVVMAELSKNPVLHLFIDVLMRLAVRYGVDNGDGSRNGCADVVAAVTAGDSARAKTLSQRQVESAIARLAARSPTGHLARARTGETRHGKRAEVLAATIGEDIAASGMPAGSVFATEPALLRRYGVSRAVLREAVRLLEYHTVARTRRGPGGGLLVTEPRAQASIDTFALYLEYRKPSREDLRLVRDAIEIDNIAKVVERRDRSAVRAFLATHHGIIDATTVDNDLRQTGRAEFLFHTGLAQLAGNAVLELFLRILVELFRRHWTGTGQPLPTPGDAADVEHAHRRIIEAIADGDDSLARYRARRHLDALASWWL